MSVMMFSHHHKEFAFDFDSSWIKASYAGGREPYTWHPPSDKGQYLNVSVGSDTIFKYRHIYSKYTEDEFLRAMGCDATNYYILKHDMGAEYLGTNGYRRYLIPTWADRSESQINMPANEDTCKFLSSDEQKNSILKMLETFDVVTNRAVQMDTTVEGQYLRYELPEYWHLFKEGIVKVNPDYKDSMNWFTTSTTCNFNGLYLIRKSLYKRMMSEFFEVLEYVWNNCSEVFPDKSKKSWPCSEENPFRYPGYLNERYFPFFMHANRLTKMEVPMAFLE